MVNHSKFIAAFAFVTLCCSALVADDSAVDRKFKSLEIRPKFKKYLTSNPLLMEVTGAKVIKLPNGRTAIVSVASTAIKKGSTTDLLRAEKVCKIKALANVVAEQKGIQVVQIVEAKDEIRAVIDDSGEKVTSVETFLNLTKTKVEGIAKDMPVVGRWYSADGDVFYLAIGTIFDENGAAILSED